MANPTKSLTTRDLSSPSTRSKNKKLLAFAQPLRFPLAVNANGTVSDVSDHTGPVQAILFSNSAIGANMTIDVQVGGVTILAAPFVHSSAYPANAEVSIPFLPGASIKAGQKVDVIRGAFTAGASVVRVLYG